MRICLLALIVLLTLATPCVFAEQEPRPNVLFIIADDLSANALGCYGNEHVRTPNLDELAKRGIVFEHAYCQYPVCGPARAALLSGLYPQQNGVTGNSSRDILTESLGEHPTLPQHFKNHGYTAARIGKLYHMSVPGDITAGVSGPDHPASWSMAFNCQGPEWMTPGPAEALSNEKLNFDPDKHYGLGFGTAFYTVRSEGKGEEQADYKAASKAIKLIGELKDKPFFIAVGFVRPHVPFVAPENFFELYDADALPLPESVENDLADIPSPGQFRIGARTGTDTDEKRRRVLQAYYASVSFMDAQVGRVLEELDKQGLTDNTIVVFLSDHGYHLGEHDMWQKMSLHEESARIPLILAGPGVGEGLRNEGMVESVDIYPSLASLAGLEIPERCMGMDLTNIGANARDYAYSLCRDGHLIRTQEWAYIVYRDESRELYDMREDPMQFTNVLEHVHPLDVLEHMHRRLQERLDSVEP